MADLSEVVIRHVRRYFRGHDLFVLDPPHGVEDRVPGLQILEVAPGPRIGLHTYLSVGCWDAVAGPGRGAEFVLTTRESDPGHVGTVCAAAMRHCATPAHRLTHGSVVALGHGWIPGSGCDRLLVTRPYPYDPDFAECGWRRHSAQLFWLMPITALEAAFCDEHGLEALESRFEAAQVAFADPTRDPVV